MIGIPHKFFIFFPAKTPIIIKYIGFIAKNNTIQAAIPASPFTKEIASQGNINIITKETINQRMNLFFIVSISAPPFPQYIMNSLSVSDASFCNDAWSHFTYIKILPFA